MPSLLSSTILILILILFLQKSSFSLMAAESTESGASILEQLMRSTVGGGGGDGRPRFFPIIVGVMAAPPSDGEQSPPPDRIMLVNPVTQRMVVLSGDTGLLSEILSERGGGLPPASKASIEAMRTVDIGDVEAEEECPVCLDGLSAAEEEKVVVKEMPCKHRFHGGCIEKWLGMHGSCPICRYRMPVEDEGGSKKEGEREREVWVTIGIGRRERERGGDEGEEEEEEH